MKTNKEKIMIGMMVLLVVTSFAFISAKDYNLYCLDRGDVMEYSLCNPNIADRVCNHDSCEYCTYVGTKGFACPASGRPDPCNARGLTCAASNYTPDLTPPEIISLSLQNGDIFNDDKVDFRGESNEITDWYYTNEEGGRWKRICRGEKICEGRIRLEDGWNNVTIKINDAVDWDTQANVSVFMDEDEPKIRKTLPKKKKFFGGNFWMQYTEYNIEEVFLTYGNETTNYTQAVAGCPEGKKQECDVDVVLDEFDGQDIFYWFTIRDIANSTGESKQVVGKVDSTFPIVTTPYPLLYSIDGKYVKFNLSIIEQNLDRVSYSYLDSRGSLKEKKLCSKLKGGVCYKKKSFSRGHHEITLNIKDEAGHNTGIPVAFDIDY